MKTRILGITLFAAALWPASAPPVKAPVVLPAPTVADSPAPLDVALDRLGLSVPASALPLRQTDDAISYTVASSQVTLGRATPSVAIEGLRITPFGSFRAAETRGGIVCYPSSDDHSALVYRPTSSGVKEDLVLLDPSAFGAGLFGWLLDLDGLEARLEDDGSIGLYGPGDELARVNVCDSQSAGLVAKARTRAAKTRLVARMPAPIAYDASRRAIPARFRLSGAMLAVAVGRPVEVSWPVTVDPSIVLTLDADLRLAGQDEGLVRYGTDQVHRDKTAGSHVPAWANAGSFTTARNVFGTAIHNKFLYVAGGFDGISHFNDVQFALVNDGGTVGAFTTTTAFPSPRRGHAFVAFGGYLYVIGGRDLSSVLADVWYAKLNTNGTISGAWQSGPTIPGGGRHHVGATVVNGTIYLAGGIDAGGATTSSVFSASIRGDGSLSPWSSTNSMTAFRNSHAVFSADGFVYAVGGNNGSFDIAATDYARVLPDGSLSVWTASTPLPGPRSNVAGTVAGGYAFAIGGGAPASGVTSAPLLPGGGFGPWTTTTPMPEQRLYPAAASYNGRVFVLGGQVPSGPWLNTVISGLPRNGDLPAWNSTATFTTGRNLFASLAYNGFLYLMGGVIGAGPTVLGDVQFAAINPDGTIGAWSGTTAFPTPRHGIAAAAYNGYLYVCGGNNSGSNTTLVHYAPIAPNGTVGAWIPGTNFPEVRNGHSLVARNGFLYVVGDVPMCRYAPINPSGSIGSWTATSAVPQAILAYTACFAYGGFLYTVGGQTSSGATVDVYRAAFISNGSLGPWSTIGSVPVAAQYSGNVHEGVVTVVNWGNPAKSYFAALNGDGSIGAFTETTAFANTDRVGMATAMANGVLYLLGGRNAALFNYTDTQFARVNHHGTVAAWAATTPTPGAARGYFRAESHNGTVYFTGGHDGSPKNDTRYAKQNPDGTLQAWQAGPNFSQVRYFHGMAVYNGTLYITGGATVTGGNSATGDVSYAKINADGTVQPWQSTTSYLSAGAVRNAHGCLAVNGYLYVIGGAQPTVGSLGDVLYAPINADGTVGAWAATTALPMLSDSPTVAAYGGRMYLVGNVGPAQSTDVLFATINTNGTLGAWQKTTALPTLASYSTAVARDGFIYVMGGSDNVAYGGHLLFAPILANGELGAWNRSLPFAIPRTIHAAAHADGFLYVLGGDDAGPGLTYVNDVQVAALRTPTAHASYSRLIDLGTDQTVSNVLTNGGGSNGTARLEIKLATSGGPDFVLASSAALPFGTAVILNQIARYVHLRYTLDDSMIVTRNPDATAHLAIDDITIATTSPPAVPVGVNQFQADGITAIPLGMGASSTTVKFISLVTDPDGDQVRLHVELLPINLPLLNVPTHTSAFVASGGTATITAILTPGVAYHWQAVTEDITGTFSTGGSVLFGGNTENPPTNPADVDFFIDQAPTPPPMSQFESDGSTPLANGGTASTSTVVLKGVRNDPDTTLSLVKVQLEFRDNGSPFTSPPGTLIPIDNITFFEAPFLAPGTTASFTISSLAPAGYKWQMRCVDDTGLASAWAVFNAAQPNFTIANPNSAPDVPVLSQTNSDDSALAVGATTNSANAKLIGSLTDPNAIDTLTLQIELRAVGIPFTSPGAPIIDGVVFFQVVAAAAGPASLTQLVSTLADGAYHWQARAVDDATPTNATSAWTSFGGNTEAEADFVVDQVNDAPAVTPASANQFQPDAVTIIAVGGNATTTGVILKAQLIDTNAGDTIKLQVEVQDVANPLTGLFTSESGFVASGATASIATGALALGSYHWAYRAMDNNGNASPWASFDTNLENPPSNPADTDFVIVANTGPVVSALAQFLADGTTVLPTGTTATSTSLVLQATLTDPEAQACTLDVEVQPIGIAFTGTPTASAVTPVASGATVQIAVTVAGQGAYHWQARATDIGGGIGAFTSYDANPEVDPDFLVELTNDPPSVPQSLGQYVPPGTSGLALGGSPLGRNVIVRAFAVDPEGRQLTLHVEVQPIGAPFTDTPTHSSAATPSGIFGSVTLGDLADGAFHWQMRSIDDSAQASAWVTYGSNPETSADFTITATSAVPPNVPFSLEQRTSNGLAVISAGSSISQAAVRVNAIVVHPRTEIVKLQIEVKPLASAFSGSVDKESDFVASGSLAEVLLFGFPNDDYHWQARAVDSKGTVSAWVSYGGNAETDPDFNVNVLANSAASLPILVGQFLADGFTLLAVGATTSQTTVVCQAFLSDPNGDAVRLEVETKPIGVPFDGASSGTSPFTSNGSSVLLSIGGLPDGRYHWRARATDSNGSSSAWVTYGANPEAEADWIVNSLSNVVPDLPTGLDQLRDDASIPVGVGQPAGPAALTFRVNGSDPDLDLLRVEVEVRSTGEAMASVPTHSSDFGPSGFVTDAVVDRFTLGVAQHWQARVVDINGQASAWVEFGGNGGSDADFVPSFNVAGQTSKKKLCGALGLEALLPFLLAFLIRRRMSRK